MVFVLIACGFVFVNCYIVFCCRGRCLLCFTLFVMGFVFGCWLIVLSVMLLFSGLLMCFAFWLISFAFAVGCVVCCEVAFWCCMLLWYVRLVCFSCCWITCA